MYTNIKIPTFIISGNNRVLSSSLGLNLKARPEFEIDPKYFRKDSNYSEWESILDICECAIKANDDIVILLRDDCIFAENYSIENLVNNIISANELGANILFCCGGQFEHPIFLKDNLFWISTISQSSFVVLFKSVYQKILDFEQAEINLDFESIISEVTSHKLMTFPFLAQPLMENGNSFTNEKKNMLGLEQQLNKVKDTTIFYRQKLSIDLQSNGWYIV